MPRSTDDVPLARQRASRALNSAKARYGMYALALAVSCASFGMALAALLQPNWVIFTTPRSSTSPIVVHSEFGLFRRCDSSSWTGDTVVCRKFPTRSSDCDATDFGLTWPAKTLESLLTVTRPEAVATTLNLVNAENARKRLGKSEDDENWSFCDSWVTAGYAQQVSLVFGAAAIIASLVILLSGRQKRESGWRIIAGLLGVHAACLIVATSLIAHEFRTDDRFYYGSRLAQGYIISTTGWALDVVLVGLLVTVGVLGLVREDDYEQIRD
ncbi:hypothetical protein OIV83_003882 [Microbotryomycetes sp. JL201]|nr:hypothetical protein OIV83_003882 [Microbotryomycetes sp. JL201]